MHKNTFVLKTPRGELEFPTVKEAFDAGQGSVYVKATGDSGVRYYGPVKAP